jgi:hypothetical protein
MRIFGLGASVQVHADGPRAEELAAALAAAWSRCLAPADGSDSYQPLVAAVGDGSSRCQPPASAEALDAGELRLYLRQPEPTKKGTVPLSAGDRDATEFASDDLATVLSSATQLITHALLAAQIGRLLLFHAGAVSHPVTGRSLVFVAEGGTGKTTLARTLGRHYGYLTDESVGIDAAHRILPYPKPLSLRSPTIWPKLETSPDAMGLLEAHLEPRVAKVVLLAREHGLESPVVTELGLLDAIAAWAPQTSSLYRLPQGLHRCADLIEATGGALEVRYAEAEDLLPLAADLIGAP